MTVELWLGLLPWNICFLFSYLQNDLSFFDSRYLWCYAANKLKNWMTKIFWGIIAVSSLKTSAHLRRHEKRFCCFLFALLWYCQTLVDVYIISYNSKSDLLKTSNVHNVHMTLYISAVCLNFRICLILSVSTMSTGEIVYDNR